MFITEDEFDEFKLGINNLYISKSAAEYAERAADFYKKYNKANKEGLYVHERAMDR